MVPAAAGGLMSYGASLPDTYRRAAVGNPANFLRVFLAALFAVVTAMNPEFILEASAITAAFLLGIIVGFFIAAFIARRRTHQ
jgi:hypothetical protein